VLAVMFTLTVEFAVIVNAAAFETNAPDNKYAFKSAITNLKKKIEALRAPKPAPQAQEQIQK